MTQAAVPAADGDGFDGRFEVGGIRLYRPFQIERLGHFGFNCVRFDEAFSFYTDLLGYRVTDVRDESPRVPAEMVDRVGTMKGYFLRYGSDHHAFVLYNQRVRELDPRRAMAPGVTTNQITWQVGSLAQVVAAHDWLVDTGQPVRRAGRDMPGSNFHTYLWDPDGFVHELYYGIEQVGWSGHSKPEPMHAGELRQVATVPHAPEQAEVEEALAAGIDLLSGLRSVDPAPATFAVDGVLLPRPFKIVHQGPVRLFVEDLDASERFFQQVLGFTLTEEVIYAGQRCVFLRAGTEHHSLALYPLALREVLGLSPHTKCLALGLRLANYRQLRDAASFLEQRGVQRIHLPPELLPGIDHAVHVRDPDGHVVELHYYMEHVGWDGRPRPPDQRPWLAERDRLEPGALPETVEARPDTFAGAPYLGPWL